MKRIIPIGLCLILSLALVVPALAQSGENAGWQAIEDERDARRKAEKLESFIRSYERSGRRPEADKMLVDFYISNKDNAKIMQHAESFRQNLPTADNPSKSYIFMQAMIAAATLNNVPKTNEFAGYALTADANNLAVLGFLARLGLPDQVKALEYAKRGIAVPKPPTMGEPQYQTLMGALHGIVANSFFLERKLKEAGEEFALAIKANPKDHASHYRLGFISLNLAVDAAQMAQVANGELLKAMTLEPANPAAVDAARAKQDAASKLALEHRDTALESLGKAVAIGGQFLAEAKPLFENVYKSKNAGSIEGQDQFLAQKRAELGL